MYFSKDEKALKQNSIRSPSYSRKVARRQFNHDVSSQFTQHITIPLKAQEKPLAFSSQFHASLQHEYGTKYLERIGVLPTPQNLAIVRKHIPIDKCKLTATWKSRGSAADVLYINPFPKCGVKKHSSEDKEGDEKGPYEVNIEAGIYGQDAAVIYTHGKVTQTFNDMKHKYLFPFNYKLINATVNNLKTEQPTRKEQSEKHCSTSQEAKTFSWIHQLRGGFAPTQALFDEFKLPPSITCDDIQSMQKEFFKVIPFEILSGFIEDDEKMKIGRLLTSEPVLQLIGFIAHYLYWKLLVPMASDFAKNWKTQLDIDMQQLNEEDHMKLYNAIINTFAGIKESLRGQKQGLSLLLPLIALSLRVSIETIYRNTYSSWFEEVRGSLQPTLGIISKGINALIDINDLFSHIASIESMPDAVRELSIQKGARRRKHMRLRDQFYATSPSIQTVFPNPSPGLSRRILSPSKGPSFHNIATVDIAPNLAAPFRVRLLQEKEHFKNLRDHSYPHHQRKLLVQSRVD